MPALFAVTIASTPEPRAEPEVRGRRHTDDLAHRTRAPGALDTRTIIRSFTARYDQIYCLADSARTRRQGSSDYLTTVRVQRRGPGSPVGRLTDWTGACTSIALVGPA